MIRTFVLRLPDGKRVRCMKSEESAIRSEVRATGTVMLVREQGTNHYRRVARGTAEARLLAPEARVVDGK